MAFRQPFDWKGALAFAQYPLAFNVETMRKLAPALVDGRELLRCMAIRGRRLLKIWGITAYEGDTHLQIIDPGRNSSCGFGAPISQLSQVNRFVMLYDFERMITDMRRLFVASETAIAPIARRMFYLEALFWLLSGRHFQYLL